MMIGVVSDEKNHGRRPPLLPSERGGNGGAGAGAGRKPKSRQVSSRYLSNSSSSSSPSTSTSASDSNSSLSSSASTPSRRCPSPLISRNSTPASVVRRSSSVDRRRPVACRPLTPDLGNVGETTAATKLLVTSIRSFSVSFQGETFSLPISKTKVPPPSPILRKSTPERRSTGFTTPLKGKIDGGGDQLENSKPIDQQRWPARIRQPNPLTKSFNCDLAGSGNEIRALQSIQQTSNETSSINNSSIPLDLTSDSDSVSSGSNSGVLEFSGKSRPTPGRIWPKVEPSSPLSLTPRSKMVIPLTFNQPKKFPSDSINSISSLSSPKRMSMSSPLRSGTRASSPSKLMPAITSLSSRGMVSPSRVRGSVVSTINSTFSDTPSVLSFAVDVRRGRVGENRIADAHNLRLLYNRQLVWRFVNARTDTVIAVQKHSAEKTLWNAWITISNLRDSVTKKRHRLQLLRQKLKLASLLKQQMTCLDNWGSLEKDHSVSLLGAIGSLKASTLRLPVIGGAIADIKSLKDVIGSAMEVMQALTSSTLCSPTLKVEEMDLLLTDLAKETQKEFTLLEHCKRLMSMLAAMQVKDCSLRTQLLQQRNRRHLLT